MRGLLAGESAYPQYSVCLWKTPAESGTQRRMTLRQDRHPDAYSHRRRSALQVQYSGNLISCLALLPHSGTQSAGEFAQHLARAAFIGIAGGFGFTLSRAGAG